MKKILFIIQSYPSERSANVLCDEKVMKELLREEGYEIHALTYQYEWQKREDIINGFHIHRLKKSFFWDFYTWSRHHPEHPIAKVIKHFQRLSLRIKQMVTIPFYPCYEPINSWLYARAAKKLHDKYHFDLVFAEHHGYDTLYAGHKLKEYAKDVKFIAALWDPFTGAKLAGYLPVGFAEKRMNLSEMKILSNADRIIAMHSIEPYQQAHAKNKPYFHKFIFLDIPGIVEPQETNATENFTVDGMINLVYAGLLYTPERDPAFILDCIQQVEWPKPVHLIFLCTGNGVDVLEKKRVSFKGKITIHPYIGQEELHAVMSHVDGFINIGSDNPGMVPSKIFEYMSYGKPILSSYVDETDASREYLERYPLGCCLNKQISIEENAKTLQPFIGEKLGQRLGFVQVQQLFPQSSPTAYLKVIQETLK